MIDGVKIIKIRGVSSKELGELKFFEFETDVGFTFKRIYYITKVKEGVTRGYHGHKDLKQVLFCAYGEIELLLDNGKEKETIILKDNGDGIVIEAPVWREMKWLQTDSVLVVAASEKYDEADYLRDYNGFLEYISIK